MMMHIRSLESLMNGSLPAAHILVENDPSAGKARVSVNGRLVMEDFCQRFNPQTLGGWHVELAEKYGTWISPETMAQTLACALSSMPEGLEVRGARYMSRG